MTTPSTPPGVTVATVLRDLADSRAVDLELLAGANGLGRHITIPHTQKTGLALSGFDAYLRGGRVLVLGESEIRYLESLDSATRTSVLRRVLSHDLPCLLVTDGFEPPAELPIEADRARVPLLRTRVATPEAMSRMSAVLDTYLAARGISCPRPIHGRDGKALRSLAGLPALIP